MVFKSAVATAAQIEPGTGEVCHTGKCRLQLLGERAVGGMEQRGICTKHRHVGDGPVVRYQKKFYGSLVACI